MALALAWLALIVLICIAWHRRWIHAEVPKASCAECQFKARYCAAVSREINREIQMLLEGE